MKKLLRIFTLGKHNYKHVSKTDKFLILLKFNQLFSRLLQTSNYVPVDIICGSMEIRLVNTSILM